MSKLIEVEKKKRGDNSSTFTNNMKLPIHRWFRYSAGYSADWVRKVINENKAEGRSRVLDPFLGSGTTILEAENCGVESIGLESHPFVHKVAESKLSWDVDLESFTQTANGVLEEARQLEGSENGYPELIPKCYPPEILKKLDSLRQVVERQNENSNEGKLIWITLASILRECSPAGTANWQYVLPNKRKAKIVDPFEAFAKKISVISQDIEVKQTNDIAHKAQLFNDDSRNIVSVEDGWADLIITSPPYANNYDYADATRLELSFFQWIEKWKDLQTSIRPHLVRACTQHVAKDAKNTFDLLENDLLLPIRNEILNVCQRLEAERHNHGGKKPYHTMIASYFLDLAAIWVELRRVTAKGAKACFVIGDSAPYGIHVPVDRWLGELAVGAGFNNFEFEKIRDRNIKWKNRTHTVPLHEGRLWING